MPQIRWARALLAGILAELCVFAIVFPTRAVLGEAAFLASILAASAALPFLLALWVNRRATSSFVTGGAAGGLLSSRRPVSAAQRL